MKTNNLYVIIKTNNVTTNSGETEIVYASEDLNEANEKLKELDSHLYSMTSLKNITFVETFLGEKR